MFIPRHPVVENQFCSYTAQTGSGAAGIGGVVAYAGSVVYLNSSATNEEAEVIKFDHANGSEVPFGFLMQKVKTGYHQVHPAGFMMPGDLGSSDVIAQPTYDTSGNITGTKSAPVGVAHMGIWDTVHYTYETGPITPGQSMFPAAVDAKVTTSTTNSDATDTFERCSTTAVARVVKGASANKAAANVANTTLYPIRIKLLV